MTTYANAPEEYRRNIDVLKNYIEQVSLFIQTTKDWTYAESESFVRAKMAEPGAYMPVDREVTFLHREENGDRKIKKTTISKYLKNIQDKHLIVAPTLTTYLPETIKVSTLGKYIVKNLALRVKHKNAQQDAEQMRNTLLSILCFILQTICKLKNNSVSGAQSSPHNPSYNKTGHSTLTSTCRCATSYANLTTERLSGGNRLYWCFDAVMEDLLCTVKYLNYDRFKYAIDKYGLKLVSVDDVMSCIMYSADLYWNNQHLLAIVRKFVSGLDSYQRSAIVYKGDLYHTAIHNPEFVRGYLDRMSEPAEMDISVEQQHAINKTTPSEIKIHAYMVCQDVTKGKRIKDIPTKDPVGFKTLTSTMQAIVDTFNDHKEYLLDILKIDVLPNSVGRVPNMIRRVVNTSDTDSTIFTNQYWTTWMVGRVDFSRKSCSVASATTYLVCLSIKHSLAMMSANIGIAKEKIFNIAMKNEYGFPFYALTPLAKHYFTVVSYCEGVFYDEPELDLKGVNLRNSTSSTIVMAKLKEWIMGFINTFMEKGELTIKEILEPVITLEKAIVNDIRSGGYNYVKSMSVKDAESYTKKEDAPNYQHHMFWEYIFAPKYGPAPELPYKTATFSLELKNKTKVNSWIANVGKTEPAMAARLNEWFANKSVVSFNTLRLPEELLDVVGIPLEVASVVEVNKLAISAMAPFYLVLETFGFYMRTGSNSRLISEEYQI